MFGLKALSGLKIGCSFELEKQLGEVDFAEFLFQVIRERPLRLNQPLVFVVVLIEFVGLGGIGFSDDDASVVEVDHVFECDLVEVCEQDVTVSEFVDIAFGPEAGEDFGVLHLLKSSLLFEFGGFEPGAFGLIFPDGEFPEYLDCANDFCRQHIYMYTKL